MPNLRLALFAFLLLPATQAHAVSKEMVQLQAQVQQLQDAVARLQQANDERMGVLKDLVQQTADSVNRMTLTVGGLQKSLLEQQAAANTKSDQLSGQLQSLNDSVDELKARMARLDAAMKIIQGQQQSAMAMLQSLPQPTGPSTPVPDTTQPPTTTSNPIPGPGAIAPVVNRRTPATPAPQAGPSVSQMYSAAYGDYMGAKYALAASEFNDLIKTYPDENLAGNAWFYLGEIDVRNAKPTNSVKDYDHLIEHYPDNAKVPAAHLHKAEAMISMKQTDGGIRELRALIQRFPNSPEAAQARTKLNALAPRR